MRTETLYKKDSKGKIRVWIVTSLDDELTEESGLKDGKHVKHVKTCKGKNIGKSNETTPQKQAELELQSKVTKQLTKGYFKTEEEAKTEEVILPMLAKDYKKESKKIDWDSDLVYAQPKLDGMRCLAIVKDGHVTLKSRDGKMIQNMGHITYELGKYQLKHMNTGKMI